MGVMNPTFFILTLFIGAVILFYMFRKQYENVVIPSNLLWEQLMNEYQASPWLDKLQRNILLLLQLLILTLLMLALVRPVWMTKGIPGEHIIIIFDRSASMSAEHEGMTRFDKAKEKLKDLTKNIRNQDVTLIGTGKVPEIISHRENNIKIIGETIDQLEMTYESSEMNKAIQYAASMAANQETSIYIYSDSVTKEDLVNTEQTDEIDIHVMNVGEPGTNISLTSFGVGTIDGEIIGLLVIENQSDKEMPATLQIHSKDQLMFEKTITLERETQEVMRIPNLPISDYYKATIITDDDYIIDNTITALYQSSPTKVYLIGDVSPFIVKGLESLGPEVIQLEEDDPSMDYSDGIIVVENMPVQSWPKRPVFAITPQKDSETELEEAIQVKDDPILHYVDFDNVYVETSFNDLDDLTTLASSGETQLIQKGIINGNPTIVVNFPIEHSDWPLHTGFPVFLYNSFQWLTANEDFIGFFQPGEKRWINADPEHSAWKIFDEQGEFIRTFHLNKENFVAPFIPGLYQAVVGENTIYFSVNLDDKEKRIPVEPSFSIDQKDSTTLMENLRPYENSWFWFTLFGLLLLFVEWEVMRRGTRA